MDPQFHALPPLKRFRLMQKQQQDPTRNDGVSGSSLPLPAKKRKETRDQALLPDPVPVAVTAYSLPAKKRVWALPPDLVSEEQVSALDLNLEYLPDLEAKKEECTEGVCENAPQESREDLCGEEECEGEVEIEGGEENEKKEECTEGVYENTQKEKWEYLCGEEDCEGEVGEDEDEDGIVCAVCKSTDGEELDPIVFCDGCDLMVHASCYGDPLVKGIPEGDWFCTQCSASSGSLKSDESFSCCLCPVNGGAMKPTGDGRWAHIVCALYVPEVFFKDPEGREGIDCSKVPKRRWKERCYVCKSASGCAIECSEEKCPLAFHVTCGLNGDLCIEYKEGKKGDIVAGFCRRHTDLWEKQQQSGKYKIVARKG